MKKKKKGKHKSFVSQQAKEFLDKFIVKNSESHNENDVFAVDELSDSEMESLRASWWNQVENYFVPDEDVIAFVANYFTVMGYQETAMSLARECEIPSPLPPRIFQLRLNVSLALYASQIEDAINLLQHEEPQILNLNLQAYFKLRVTQLTQLLPHATDQEALTFIHKYLTPCAIHANYLYEEIEKIMIQLVFPESRPQQKKQSKRKMYDTLALIDEIDEVILEYFGICPRVALSLLFSDLMYTQLNLSKSSYASPTPFFSGSCPTHLCCVQRRKKSFYSQSRRRSGSFRSDTTSHQSSPVDFSWDDELVNRIPMF